MKNKMYRPCEIIKKINDNAYVVDIIDNLAISLSFNVANIFEYFSPEDSSSNSRTIYFQEGETDVVPGENSLPGNNFLLFPGKENFLPFPGEKKKSLLGKNFLLFSGEENFPPSQEKILSLSQKSLFLGSSTLIWDNLCPKHNTWKIPSDT
jgi:hypothetical protein